MGRESSIKGKRWYNNGIIEKTFYKNEEIPEGFTHGRLESVLIKTGNSNRGKKQCKELLEKKREISSGRTVYNDGNKEYYLKDYSPEKYPDLIKGRLLKNCGSKRNTTGGTICINNGLVNKHIPIGSKIPEGFIKGVIRKNNGITPERNKKISEASRGCKWYNNGIENRRFKEGDIIPDGFVLGMSPDSIERNRKAQIGSKQSDTTVKKRFSTMKNNGNLNTSKAEEKLYLELCTKYGKDNIERQYRNDQRYPFACDFYIKSEDLFIELNRSWTHGGKIFDDNDPECLEKLKIWKEKAESSKYYKNAIRTWTEYDVIKYRTALKNNLNYKIIW